MVLREHFCSVANLNVVPFVAPLVLKLGVIVRVKGANVSTLYFYGGMDEGQYNDKFFKLHIFFHYTV